MMKVEYKRKYIKTTSVLCSAKFWIYLISIILLVLIVAPIIRAASCGVLNVDDFLMMNTVLKAEGYSGFSKAFANMKYYYNEWSGSYAVYFIEAFLAYLISLHNRLVPIYLAGTIILFICLYAILASLMCEHAGTGKVTAFWIFVGTIIPFFGFNYYTEVFYWFVGNCAYCMSFIVGFAELILLLLSDKYKSKILLCLSILTAVVVGGMWVRVWFLRQQ